jgi:mannose-6-phosphate isomerase-like protein (cupin superfamily)
MDVQCATAATVQHEKGYSMRRLFPWRERADTPWGSAWIVIAPGGQTPPHWHDEEETFVVMSGAGAMTVDGETKHVTKGDVIYLPRCSIHVLRNTDTCEQLEMLCIWWGGDERTVNRDVPCEPALADS